MNRLEEELVVLRSENRELRKKLDISFLAGRRAMIRMQEELEALRSENRELRKKLDEARQLLLLLRDRAGAVADENRKLHDALARLDTTP